MGSSSARSHSSSRRSLAVAVLVMALVERPRSPRSPCQRPAAPKTMQRASRRKKVVARGLAKYLKTRTLVRDDQSEERTLTNIPAKYIDFDGDRFLDEIGPYPYRGHTVRAFARSGNVSSSGAPAIVSNARWLVEVDGAQISGGLYADPSDEPNDVMERLKPAIDVHLDGRGG